MIAPMFDTCMLCGRRTRKPGEALCITHDFEALISLSYERMIERVRGNIPARDKSATKKRDNRRARIGASKRNISKANEDLFIHEM